jgi:TatD DNase family protein
LKFEEASDKIASSENVLFSIGIHPWFANEFTEQLFNQMEKWVEDSKIVAIGECGLDKNSKATFNEQVTVFEKQIQISEKIHKPLIIHCVGYFNELFELKKSLQPQQLWIIHGFRGKPQLASQVLKAGCALSFGEYFNNESVLLTPINKLFVETDESNLSIDEIYRRIAAIKNISIDSLSANDLFFSKNKS